MNEYQKMFLRTQAKVLNEGYSTLLEDLIKIIEDQSAQIKELKNSGDNLEHILTNKLSSYEVSNACHNWKLAKNENDKQK